MARCDAGVLSCFFPKMIHLRMIHRLHAILESEFASSFKTFGPTLSELESLGNRFKDCCEEAAGSLAHGLFAKWSEPLVRSLRRIV